jgi:DNA-binding CsgD family transcriptional regulator
VRVLAPTLRLVLLAARTCDQQTIAARRLLEQLDKLIARLTAVIPPLVRASRAACTAECSRIAHAGDATRLADARRQWETCENRYHAAYARWREAEAMLAAGGKRTEVETLVREGYAVADGREIGAELFIGDKTATVHVSRILSKLSVPNRAAAAAVAQRLGIQAAHVPSAT